MVRWLAGKTASLSSPDRRDIIVDESAPSFCGRDNLCRTGRRDDDDRVKELENVRPVDDCRIGEATEDSKRT